MGTLSPAGVTPAQKSAFQAFFSDLREDAEVWAREGRSWLVRAPLLAYLAYAFFRHLTNPLYGSVFAGINLGIHELGHVVTSFAPSLIVSLAGSFFEVAVPAAGVMIFYRQRDYFGMAVAGVWMSFALFEVATYMADARVLALPGISVGGQREAGDSTGHDWYHIFKTLHLMPLAKFFAFLTRTTAFLIGGFSLVAGTWLCVTMARRKEMASKGGDAR